MPCPGAAMQIGQFFNRIWVGILSLVRDLLSTIAWIVTIAASLCFLFVISAQLTRLHDGGGWNSVTATEFLEIFGVSVPTSSEEGVPKAVDFLLAAPATVLLLVVALGFYFLTRLLNPAQAGSRRPIERANSSTDDDVDLLAAIERALDDTAKRAKQ